MSKRSANMSLMELVDYYQDIVPGALEGMEIRADAISAARRAMASLAAVMMTMGEAERTRATFREAAEMFQRLADAMEETKH